MGWKIFIFELTILTRIGLMKFILENSKNLFDNDHYHCSNNNNARTVLRDFSLFALLFSARKRIGIGFDHSGALHRLH